jgi:hypothetical protein
MLPNENPEHYDIFYIDSDKDEIKVTTQEDYTIALIESKLEFIIKKKRESERLGFVEVSSDNSQVQLTLGKSYIITENYNEAKGYIQEPRCQQSEPNPFKFEEVKLRTCFKCNGAKVNKKGKECGICAGKGYLDQFKWSLKKYIEKSIKKDMARLIEDEVKKSIAFQMNSLSSLASNLSPANSSIETAYCSLCKRLIGAEEKMYRCLSCNEFYLCESCEEDHPHQLIRTRGREGYKMEILSEGKPKKKGSQLVKIWTVKNNGKKKWPKEVKVTLIEGEYTKVNVLPISELSPGKECKIVLSTLQPSKDLRQTFQLEGNNKKFGAKLLLELKSEVANSEKETKKRKTIEKYVEELSKTEKFDKKYKENMKAIMGMGNWHPADILRCLINNNNDIEKTITELIPDN